MEIQHLIRELESNLHRFHELFAHLEGSDTGPPSLARLVHILSTVHEEVVDYRLKKILREEHPYLPQIDPATLPAPVSPDSPPQVTATRFLDRRRELIKLLERVPKESWKRTGVHETEGHVTFGELVRRMVEKDLSALEDLDSLIAREAQQEVLPPN